MYALDLTRSELRRLFQPSIIKVFKNKLWLWAAVQGEGMMNAPFPVGSIAESPWIQLFPCRQKEVKKTDQIPISFLPHNQFSDFLTCYGNFLTVAGKEDCFWLYVLQRIHRISLVSDPTRILLRWVHPSQCSLVISNQQAAFLLLSLFLVLFYFFCFVLFF